MWRLEDNFLESVFPFHRVGLPTLSSGGQGGWCVSLPTEPSHQPKACCFYISYQDVPDHSYPREGGNGCYSNGRAVAQGYCGILTVT